MLYIISAQLKSTIYYFLAEKRIKKEN